MRRLRLLTMALMAALALSATAAASASAEPYVFTSEAEDTVLKGEQVGTSKMGVSAGTVSCEHGTLSGTESSALSAAIELPLTASYEKCTAFGVLSAEVKMNSCEYLIGAGEKEGESYEAEASIYCAEPGDAITATAKLAGVTKCTVRIGPQDGLHGITVEKEGSPSEIRAKLHLTEIEYDQVAGTGLGACSTAENTKNGTYESTVTIDGRKGESLVNLTPDPIPEYIEFDPKSFKFTGLNSVVKFKIKNITAAKLSIIGVIAPSKFIAPQKKCWGKDIAKKGDAGDSCEEEIKCVKLSNLKIDVAALATSPLGGTKAVAEGC